MTKDQLEEIRNVMSNLIGKNKGHYSVTCVNESGVYMIDHMGNRIYVCVFPIEYSQYDCDGDVVLDGKFLYYKSRYRDITFVMGYDPNKVSFYAMESPIPDILLPLIRKNVFEGTTMKMPSTIHIEACRRSDSSQETEVDVLRFASKNIPPVEQPEERGAVLEPLILRPITSQEEMTSRQKAERKPAERSESWPFVEKKPQKPFEIQKIVVPQPHSGAKPLHKGDEFVSHVRRSSKYDDEEVVTQQDNSLQPVPDPVESFVFVPPTLVNAHGIQELTSLNKPLWQALRDRDLCKQFKAKYKEESSDNYRAELEIEAMFRYLTARNDSAHKKKLLACKTVDEFKPVMERVMDIFYRPEDTKSNFIPELIYKFLDFILDKEYELEHPEENAETFSFGGITLSVNAASERRSPKKNQIEITYPNGVSEALIPIDALVTFFRYVGYDRVAEKNWKITGMPLLTQHPSTDTKRWYKELEDGWFMCVQGDTKLRLRTMIGLNESLNVGLKFKMV